MSPQGAGLQQPLVIMDAVVGIQGNGPTNKFTYNAGKILASDNGVCLDAVMAQMMGIRPRKIRMLELANECGLGEIDTAKIDVIGDGGKLRRFRKPVPSVPQLFGWTWTGAFFPDIGHPRFDLDREACTSCGNCEEACPARAIKVEKNGPCYDYEKCISCYCCMELCPRSALSLHETFRTRIYRRLGYM